MDSINIHDANIGVINFPTVTSKEMTRFQSFPRFLNDYKAARIMAQFFPQSVNVMDI